MVTTRISLLERLRSPADESAWARFVDLYTPLMLRWGSQLGLQPNDTADLTQDVMTLLVQKFATFQYDTAGKFRAWLRTVFINKHRERLRKKAELPHPQPEAFEHILSPAEAVDDAEDRRLLVRRGLELIQPEFSPTVWRAFWEYAVCGRPPGEVARELGLAAGTIYASKSRVLNRLRLEVGFLPD